MARTGRTFENLISGFGLMMVASYAVQYSDPLAEGIWRLNCLIDGRCPECGYKLESIGHANSTHKEGD